VATSSAPIEENIRDSAATKKEVIEVYGLAWTGLTARLLACRRHVGSVGEQAARGVEAPLLVVAVQLLGEDLPRLLAELVVCSLAQLR
jgi:hypothetical protein